MHGTLLRGKPGSVEVIAHALACLADAASETTHVVRERDLGHSHRKQIRLSSEQGQGASSIIHGRGRCATGHAKRTCRRHPTRTASSPMHLPWRSPTAVACC